MTNPKKHYQGCFSHGGNFYFVEAIEENSEEEEESIIPDCDDQSQLKLSLSQ